MAGGKTTRTWARIQRFLAIINENTRGHRGRFFVLYTPPTLSRTQNGMLQIRVYSGSNTSITLIILRGTTTDTLRAPVTVYYYNPLEQ